MIPSMLGKDTVCLCIFGAYVRGVVATQVTPVSHTAYCMVRSQKSLKSAHPSGHVLGVSRGIRAIHRPSVPNKHRPSNGQHHPGYHGGTKPIDCSHPNLEVVKYVVLGAHPRHGRSGAARQSRQMILRSSWKVRRPDARTTSENRTPEQGNPISELLICLRAFSIQNDVRPLPYLWLTVQVDRS